MTLRCLSRYRLIVTFGLFLSSKFVFAQTFIHDPESDSLFIPPLTYEYIPDATYNQIEKRLKNIEAAIPLNFNERVKSFIDYFTVRDREYTKMVLRRSTYYFPIFEEILAKHNLPDELKYLAIVESGLNSTARSWAAAVGLWQFIYYTGRTYGLHADWYVDERMDPVKSTEAAARYIKSLYNMFGDWELALAAYNCGPGNVRKAIRRSGYKRKFWDIYRYLPRETRGYVPQFVAITYAFNYTEEHNLILDDSEYMYPMATDTIMVKDFLNLSTLGSLIDVCDEEMDFLNPSIKRKAVPQSPKYFSVRIPSDKMGYFNEHRSAILDSASKTGKKELEYLARNTVGSTYGRDKVIHRVRSGDVLGRIAQRYRVRVSDIKKWNNLRSNTIRVGQRLNIWLLPNTYSSTVAQKKPTKTQDLVVDGTKYHIVQPGDTLWDISKAYSNMSIEKLKKLNNLKSNRIKPGQKLVVG
ncbi:MAG: LysM peptidoglycan-binding domain-containing protein [Cytophagales bacterium]|nr:LysM peptidoglycan-binding domain-containing protein [Cytophagales bacterium]